MEHLKKKQQTNETVYILAYVIFIIKFVLDASSLVKRPEIVDLFLIIAFLSCIGYKLVNQSYSRWGILFFGMLLIFFLYSSIAVSYFTLLFSFLCISALQNVCIRKVLKVSVLTKLIILAMHVILYIAFYIFRPEVFVFIYRDGIIRHSFYMGHPNLFTAYLVWTCLEIIYLNYKQIKKLQLLIIWLVNVLFYQFTDTNTGIIVLTGVILAIFIEKKEWSNAKKILSFLSKYSFAICSIIFPIIVVVYTKLSGTLLSLWYSLNVILNGRLMYGAYAYDVFGFAIWGRSVPFPVKVHWRGNWLDVIIFDNSYIWLFIVFGILNLFILSIAFYLLERKTSCIEKIIIIAFVFYGIMEAYIVNITVCFPLLFIGKYLYEHKDTMMKRSTEGKLWKQS